jgi:hypothetical protein
MQDALKGAKTKVECFNKKNFLRTLEVRLCNCFHFSDISNSLYQMLYPGNFLLSLQFPMSHTKAMICQ